MRGKGPDPVLPDPVSPDGSPGWSLEDVRYAYPQSARAAVDGVSLAIESGRCTALLGPNGSGKSTLLRLLLGTLRPAGGTIHFGGRSLARWRRGELAKTVGVVPQHEEVGFPLSVGQLVAMGRYPHLGLLKPEGPADRAAVEAAIDRCDIRHLRDRRYDTLSGGERQRARLARALAQEPRVLALDEPTLALDVRHEMEIFELIRDLSIGGVTVLLVTHNLNLAARYSDTLVLLHRGRLVASGSAESVLKRELLEAVYEWPVRTDQYTGPGNDAGVLQVTPLGRPRQAPSRLDPRARLG